MRTVLGAAVCTVLVVLLIGPFLSLSPSRTLRLPGSILLSQIIETNPTPPIEQDPTPPIEKDATPPIEEDPSPPIEKDPTPPIDENPSPPIEKQSMRPTEGIGLPHTVRFTLLASSPQGQEEVGAHEPSQDNTSSESRPHSA